MVVVGRRDNGGITLCYVVWYKYRYRYALLAMFVLIWSCLRCEDPGYGRTRVRVLLLGLKKSAAPMDVVSCVRITVISVVAVGYPVQVFATYSKYISMTRTLQQMFDF